jgi:DNA-binding response OmpR family regulator
MIHSIVLAEDNLEQCFFFQKALKEIEHNSQLTIVHDGDNLIALLERFLPDILFLDLSMPCKDGMQCIKEIRDNNLYDGLPIVVFSVSKQNTAIQTAYGFGANLYFVKPNEYSELVSSLKSILSINWTNLKSITEKHFESNKYLPFQLSA